VQVDPIEPTLKAPISERVILKYDERLSNFTFRFNSRRYTMTCTDGTEATSVDDASVVFQAGAYTRSLLSST